MRPNDADNRPLSPGDVVEHQGRRVTVREHGFHAGKAVVRVDDGHPAVSDLASNGYSWCEWVPPKALARGKE